MEQEFRADALGALGREAVAECNQEYRERHADRDVRIGRRHGAQVFDAKEMSHGRQQVDRQHVHEVHQEHPETDEQRGRRHESGAVVIGVLDLRVDRLHAQFDEILPFARHAAGRLARRDAEHDDEDQRQHDREQERIQMQHPEAAGFRIDAHRVQIQLEVGQVVQDVAAGVVGAFSRHVPKESSCAIQRPISCRARSAVQS